MYFTVEVVSQEEYQQFIDEQTSDDSGNSTSNSLDASPDLVAAGSA
jgi:heme/copper-type cytochrome/quinol oxidase subunit 2